MSESDESGLSTDEVAVVSSGRRMARLLMLTAFGFGVGVLAVYTAVELPRQHATGAHFAPKRWVDLETLRGPSKADAATDSRRENLIRVAVAPVVSPEKSLQLYRKFVDWLGRRLDRVPVCLLRGSYSEVNDLVRYNLCDMAFVCTYPFVRGEHEFGMEVLGVPQVAGELSYRSLILVPSSSQAASLLDLRGKRFASGDVQSTSGWVFPALQLIDQGENPDTFFGKHVITGSHDRSVSAVVTGFVDGAAVHSLVYEQLVEEEPTIAEKTKVILESPPFGMPPVVVSPQLDPDLKAQLRAVMLSAHTDAAGKQVLASLRIERFVAPEEGLYDTVRELSAAWEAWESQR